ncbi:MAG TPA: spore photoproduct lyase, partial [Desulfobacteria bacterium]|nr:spore photoproduct lyase [Desulfobacteria bacterium]
HTRFRFSLNCEEVIRNFEHGTPSAKERLAAAGKVLQAGYPLGFIIAPLFRFENWEDQYTELFISLSERLRQNHPDKWSATQLSFEFITHRFTTRAKSNILKVFPHTSLPMDETSRKYKFGQFGYGKYVYQPEEMAEFKSLLLHLVDNYFPGAGIEYFV